MSVWGQFRLFFFSCVIFDHFFHAPNSSLTVDTAAPSRLLVRPRHSATRFLRTVNLEAPGAVSQTGVGQLKAQRGPCVTVSGGQQRDSATRIHVSNVPQSPLLLYQLEFVEKPGVMSFIESNVYYQKSENLRTKCQAVCSHQ